MESTNIVLSIREFVAPIYLLIVSLVAIIFLIQRKTRELIQFMIIAVVVGVLLYSPEIIKTLADILGGVFTNA
jgi:sugar phosphate permease